MDQLVTKFNYSVLVIFNELFLWFNHQLPNELHFYLPRASAESFVLLSRNEACLGALLIGTYMIEPLKYLVPKTKIGYVTDPSLPLHVRGLIFTETFW